MRTRSLLPRARTFLPSCRDLLDKGNACASSVDRLLYVTAFAVTAYQGTLDRVSKPFNPLLGETFEWQSADGRTRLIAEQVSGSVWVKSKAFE